MSWFSLFMRRRIFSDISEEIQQHLTEKIEALIAEGMSRDQAEHEAKRAFGNVTRIEESAREAWIWPKTESILTDFKFAARKLLRSPGFATAAILTLALGIGANVIVFSVLNGLILRPLDVPHPENLFHILHGKEGFSGQSYRDYVDYRDRDPSFSGILACQYLRVGLEVGNSVIPSWGFAASGNYFDVLGVRPALGRFFHAVDEHGPGSAPYLVISYDLWRRLNHDSNVLGGTIELNQHPFTVIGVAPEGFHGTDALFWPDYWVPIMNAAQVTGFDDLPYRDHFAFAVFGRLKAGVTPAQANESLNALASQMAKEDPKDDGLNVRVRVPGPAGDDGDPTKPVLLGIMLLAFLVLFAACANLASIFAARAADRGGELAIRLAIGSSRWIVLRQLVVEAVAVSLAGGLLGSLLARLALGVLSHLRLSGDFPTHFPIFPDARVYVAALTLSVASGLVFGLLPGRQVWQTDVMQAIKGGCLCTHSFRRFALRDILLVIQIVVCTLLVTATLVAIRGMIRALHEPLAFHPEDVTLAWADLRMAGHPDEEILPLQKRMAEAAGAIPGVTAASVVDSVPFLGGGEWFVYRWGTTDFLPSHRAFAAPTFLIAPGYLKTAETPLLAGRDFTWHDDSKSPEVAIVNQTFAHRLFGNASAIGQRFALWETAKYEIVGVVADGKYVSFTEESQPAMFLPLAQGVGGVISSTATILVRSYLPTDQVTAALDHTLRHIEPNAPFTVRRWADVIDLSMLPARTATAALCVMGFLSAMLAVTGVFGMASYAVSKRMREQGIRMALGAQRSQVVRSTLFKPLLLLFSGSAIGLGAGVLTSGVLSHFMSLATTRDPLVLFGVFLTMTLLGLLGTWIPARRALGIDPVRLLRDS
jgi:predicted permease